MSKYFNKNIPTVYRKVENSSVGFIMETVDYSGKFYYKSDDFWIRFNDGTELSINGKFNSIDDSITTIEGNISIIQGDITNIQSNITTIQGDITTIQGDITTIQGDISGLTGGAFEYVEITGEDTGYIKSNTSTITTDRGVGSVDLQMDTTITNQIPSGNHSLCGGIGCRVTGNYSIAYGNLGVVTGDRSASFGTNTVNGNGAFAAGQGNYPAGDYTIALGIGNGANSFGEIVVGTYASNIAAISETSFNSGDYAFRVGNGTDAVQENRSDVFRVKKNGTTYILNQLVLNPISTAPSTPEEGMIYINSSDNTLYIYLNSA